MRERVLSSRLKVTSTRNDVFFYVGKFNYDILYQKNYNTVIIN